MKSCLVCRQGGVRELIDFGELPICHHFYDGHDQERTHPAALGQCGICGAVQMMEPISPAKLVPRFDWITYNEPEAHLDAMVEMLLRLPGIHTESVIAGLTYKEDTTLRRFRERGCLRTWRADLIADFGITEPKAGIETVQGRVRPDLADPLQAKHGVPDLIIVRHVLEHTHDPAQFLETFRRLVKPTGYVVFEVPDCQRAFDLLDYTTLWEDHTIYFVEPTFLATLRLNGFSVVHFERYHAAYENCLVAVVRSEATDELTLPSESEVKLEQQRAVGFAEGFDERRAALKEMLTLWRSRGKIAVFGAGHQSAMFVNLHRVAESLEFVVDDDPRKRGMRMPGSRLPIVGSELLVREDIKFCLSSLSAESEKKVIQKQAQFLKCGGTFASIFPVTRDTLINFVAGSPAVA
jgi:hypothetical protein